jgi:hypothetical protein
MLPQVVESIASSLDYQQVVLDLVEPGTGELQVRTAIGVPGDVQDLFPPTDPALVTAVLDDDALQAGYRVLGAAEAQAVLGPDRATLAQSRMNGVGDAAWDGHVLVLPVRGHRAGDGGRAGGLIGVLWLQDPADRLLPNPGRLRALRAFAGLTGLAVAQA